MKSFPLLYRLTPQDIKGVSNNFKISYHAKERLKQRFNYKLHGTVKNAIRNCFIAYVSNDGSLSVCTSDGGIFKFVQPKGKKTKFHLITFYEPTMSKEQMLRRYHLTMKGYNF